MSEFDLIRQHFIKATQHTNLGIGDDAALISVPIGVELAISTDMLVAGTHFFADIDAYQLGWKSLAVNVSDMAAMGANPKWATLAIALPAKDAIWLSQFSNGFFACAKIFNIDLIGGDTTRGPLTISVQIMGETPHGEAIKRSGAKIGDDIWVSGVLGDAALALAHIQNKCILTESEFLDCAKSLHMPQPRVTLGLALRNIANSAVDISDGLISDLSHILYASQTGAELRLNDFPCSNLMQKYRVNPLTQTMILAGGDDYELCFTAPADKHDEIISLGERLDLKLTKIGNITHGNGLIVRDFNDEVLSIKETGFDHFN
ncbi:MAG: thiamine-phosphate kinase [Methylophilaceae bacterium]|nr:thiamine-phosphate kinase [Methylophilaceae bacterium]